MSDIKKWISLFESKQEENAPEPSQCNCTKWNCKLCFPEKAEKVDEGNWYEPELQDLHIDSAETETLSPEDYQQAWDMISIIKDAQIQGTGGGEKNYSESELENMSMSQLRAVYKEVTGSDLIENNTKVKDKTGIDYDPFDNIDDVLNPRVPSAPNKSEDPSGDDSSMFGNLPRSGAENTRSKVSNINPSPTMRDFMSRVNPDAGAGEADLTSKTSNDVAVRTSDNLPASIENAMVATGFQSPEWHTIDNLPGFMQRAVRGTGRQMFGMITSTPLEEILTIANVEGQGPNTDAEMRAVAGWLLKNAEDLGTVKVSHGMAIPGYEPDVREFRANGVRFHVVRDPMGQYIYAFPEKDAKNSKPEQTKNLRGNSVPRINEHYSPSIMEQIRWDEEIDEILREEEELEESTLSRLIGKQAGGQKLVRWLHSKHKLSNEASLEPVPFNKELLWTQFKKNPDDFVIVSGSNGVAGIKPSAAHIEKMKEIKAKKGQVYNPAGDSTMPYQIIAFTDDGQQVDPALLRPSSKDGEERDPDPTVMKARMGKTIGRDIQNSDNTFALLQQQIGTLKTVWISGWSGFRGTGEEPPEPTGAVERDKIARRASMKAPTVLSDTDATNQIFKRIRPVLSTITNQAMSHVMRRAQRFIEGGNFEGARELARKGENLKRILATIDTTRDITLNTGYDSMTRELSLALEGAIETAFQQSDYDKKSEFLNDVAKGNATALKPILDGIRAKIIG